MNCHTPKKPEKKCLDLVAELLQYNPDTGSITWKISRNGNHKKIGDQAGYVQKNGYRVIGIFPYNNKKAHHIAWFLMTGEWPDRPIDHINQNKDDNRWENLRKASSSINCANRKLFKNNKTGFTGVNKRRERTFYAYIQVNKKTKHLGCFRTAEEAAKAYNEFVIEKKLEDFYPLNVIPQPNQIGN